MHTTPLAQVACQVSHNTARLAWGTLATSCATALSRLERGLPAAARPMLHRQARAALGGGAWSGPRPTITLATQDGPYGACLVHERHTCCLIRLGEGHEPCITCPQLTPRERRSGWEAAARTPAAMGVLDAAGVR